MSLWASIKYSRIYAHNKWTLNLQAAPLGDYQHRTRPPHWRPTSIEWAPHAMGASTLPHRSYHKLVLKTSAKKTYDHPVCPPRNGRFKPTSPVVLQASTQNFSKEDLRPSSVSPTQRARFKPTSAVCHKRPFSGPTAAGMCPCNDSREQWC
jgi:hypothetical protein